MKKPSSSLGRPGLGDVSATVAYVHTEQAEQSIEVAVAVFVPDVTPVTLDDDRVLMGVDVTVHPREVHPQVAARLLLEGLSPLAWQSPAAGCLPALVQGLRHDHRGFLLGFVGRCQFFGCLSITLRRGWVVGQQTPHPRAEFRPTDFIGQDDESISSHTGAFDKRADDRRVRQTLSTEHPGVEDRGIDRM